MKRKIGRLAGLLTLAALALPASAGCKLQSVEIPVRLVNARPIATVGINGVDLPLLVDSGAFYSFLSPSVVAQLKLPLYALPPGLSIQGHAGEVEARLTQVDKVRLQGAELPKVDFVVGGNELGSGIQGILGRNFLSGADTEYDLARGMVRLMFPNGDCEKTQLVYWAGEAPIISERLLRPSDRRDTAARVIVTVNGTRLRALLDTGAPVTTLLRSAAKRAGIEEKDMTPAGRVGGAGVGKVRAWTATVASFEFGGEKIQNNQFAIDEAESQDHDMIIGLDYFLSHRIYVSRLQKQVYATWNGGAVFARDGKIGESDARHAAAPTELAPDDAEGLAVRAAAAVLRGDHAAALRDLDRACEIAPTVARHFMARSQVRLGLRQPREALNDLDEALRLQPDLGEARLSRARLRLGFADRTGADADLNELDRSLSPSSPLRAGMGTVYVQLNRVPEALRQWELWIPTHVDDNALPGILNQRCWLRARLNIDLPEALKDCKKAVSKDGGEPGYRNSLGWLYLRMGEASSARKALEASIEMKPFAWSLYGRAVALQQLGQTELAQRDLEAARKLNPKIDAEVRRAGFEALLAAPPA